MKTVELKIEGMTCGHCAMSVKKELGKIPGLKVEDVQIGKTRVSFDDTKITEQDLSKAIEEAGYTLVSA